MTAKNSENTATADNLSYFRSLRKTFMVKALQTGHDLIDFLSDTDPELATKLRHTFRNEGSAAFFLATDTSSDTGLTPMMELARNNRPAVIERLEHYVPMHLRYKR